MVSTGQQFTSRDARHSRAASRLHEPGGHREPSVRNAFRVQQSRSRQSSSGRFRPPLTLAFYKRPAAPSLDLSFAAEDRTAAAGRSRPHKAIGRIERCAASPRAAFQPILERPKTEESKNLRARAWPGGGGGLLRRRKVAGRGSADNIALNGRALNNSRALFLQDLCQQLRTDLARFALSLSSDMARTPSAKRTEPVPPASSQPTQANRKPLISKEQGAGTPLEMQNASQPGVLPCNTFTVPSSSPRC